MTSSFITPFFVRQTLRPFLLLGLWLSALVPLHAQEEAARINTQQGLVNRPGTEALQAGTPYQITSSDLGEIDLVARAPRPKMFTFSTSQSFNYTTNAFLVNNGEQDA